MKLKKNHGLYKNSNEYVSLLKRLDEAEGLIGPSIEEKLKMTEDYLRVSCSRFCENTSTHLNYKEKDVAESLNLAEPQMILERTEAKALNPSFCSPKTQLKTVIKRRRKVCSLKKPVEKSKGDDATAKKLQQAYYLPSSSQKPSTDLSKEEVELLSSCTTKAFVKFLAQKKMEVPRIFDFHYTKYVAKGQQETQTAKRDDPWYSEERK